MTDLIAIADISDELPPAFMILDDESCQNITAIFSSDKTKFLRFQKLYQRPEMDPTRRLPSYF